MAYDIKQTLRDRLLGEDVVPGVKQTQDVQKIAKKQNKAALKDVEKTMKDYEAPLNPDDKEENELSPELRGGMEELEYDSEPSEQFKERAEKAIEGDSTMGNGQGKNEEYGNTEATWGASSDDFGKKLVKNTKEKKAAKDAAQTDLISLGDDIEVNPKQNSKKKKVAVESTDNNSNTIKETKMKTLKRTFKKSFKELGNPINLIPESYKVDSNEFVLSDGNETYRMRWEGDVNEGTAVVLTAEDKSAINEDMNKMNHLMNYSSREAQGTLRDEDRITENDNFTEVWNLTDKMLNEAEEIAEAKLIAEAEAKITGDVEEKSIDLTESANWFNKIAGVNING
jgi:hypothetical protein